ncbi:hypothetical protein BYT27DRAFT_7193172 [Phlegmacium glaucopus]|nr:hypothetical protein BYT27DRAFT_7193172 [Phlegmacium glaucopus]
MSQIFRGASPVIVISASNVADHHNTSTLDGSASQTPVPNDSASRSISPSNSASVVSNVRPPVRHYIFETFFFGLFCSTIPMYFMAFEHFARNARLASLSAATPTLLSKWYTLWASVFLGIGVAAFLLLCDFLMDLPAAFARKDGKWYRHQFALFHPNIVTIGEDLAITGRGIVLWRVWAVTLEGLLLFCTKKELIVSWGLGCQCQSYIGAILWAFGILRYASFTVILFQIWVIMILTFISETVSPISSDHPRARQVVEACFLIISIVISTTTVS